jgi:septal ring factor EnvC (AmiA/AmiB activator)
MKNDFKKMEEEMDNLSDKMSAITAFNDKISNTLQDKRVQITKLSGVHALLRKVRTQQSVYCEEISVWLVSFCK